MAVSGIIGQTVFNTRKVVDSAYGACRLPRQAITGELINTALEQLNLMLSEWASIGVPLWCQQKYILPLYTGVYSVPFPDGTVDVLNANLRTLRRLEGTATASTGIADNSFDDDFETVTTLVGITAQNITLQLETATVITTVGFLPGSTGTWSYTLQYSNDGVGYTTFYTDTAYAAVGMTWLWLDFQGLPEATYWRIEIAAASMPASIREIVWAHDGTEINMARINKDDYFYLPDKNVRGRPVQFWVDRTRLGPVMNVWPAPDVASRYRQITALVHRQIMDVGTLRQEVEVPQRAYNAVVWNLAAILAIITPEVKPEMIPVTREQANVKLGMMWRGDTDSSPVNIQIDLSPYTR